MQIVGIKRLFPPHSVIMFSSELSVEVKVRKDRKT